MSPINPLNAYRPPDRIIALGASAGGLDPLIRIINALPNDFPGHILAILHRRGRGHLPDILARNCRLPVRVACDGLRPGAGQVTATRGDEHVQVIDGAISTTPALPKDKFVPSIDKLFQSLAQSRVPVVGVVLSGAMQDGLAGALALHQAGHALVVQDPDEAQFASMPQALMRRDHPSAVLRVDDIAWALCQPISLLAS